ncbi:MAG: hypothetical protein K0Q72_3349 [Armatimonadetes bacterium]|jgi:hypothetical protein|nr:hypothetical protein [Armatimonadota bacterium]
MAAFISQLIRSRWTNLAAVAVIVAALLLPPDRGFGLPLCQFRSMTHLPCLACGLTRSYIALAHLDVSRGAFYHPLGLVLFPFTLFVGAMVLVREPVRARVAGWVERQRLPLNRIGAALLVFFIVYGFGRMAWLLVTRQPSPW